MNKSDSLKKKLLYRSNYRGTKELDILLGTFVKNVIDKLSLEDLENLNKFLKFEDEIIYNFYQYGIDNHNLKKNPISELLKNFKL
jgi:antitoxin CptB